MGEAADLDHAAQLIEAVVIDQPLEHHLERYAVKGICHADGVTLPVSDRSNPL